jgi:aspartate aminotransferase
MRIAARIGALGGEGAMEVYARARELEAAGRDIIHLELGEPDFHPAMEVIATAQVALTRGRDRYCPPCGLPELRAALAEHLALGRELNLKAENVAVTSGCKLALFLTMLALIEPGDEVLCPEPSFPAYPSITRGLGATPVTYRLGEERGFQPDAAEIAGLATAKTRGLILCSPNNPTGTVYGREAMAAIAKLARERDWWVISDEVYARIVYGQRYESIAALAGMQERTAIIDGFSKTYAMTGWRLGFAAGPRELIAALEMLIVNSFTCAPEFIQVAAVEALRDRSQHAAVMVAEYARRRERFVQGINAIPGLACVAPEGAFYAWVKVQAEAGRTAAAVQRALLEEAGVAAIHGRGFGASGEEYLRFSFADGARMDEALTRIEKCLGNRGTMGSRAGGD